jgi:hypothetical protein
MLTLILAIAVLAIDPLPPAAPAIQAEAPPAAPDLLPPVAVAIVPVPTAPTPKPPAVLPKVEPTAFAFDTYDEPDSCKCGASCICAVKATPAPVKVAPVKAVEPPSEGWYMADDGRKIVWRLESGNLQWHAEGIVPEYAAAPVYGVSACSGGSCQPATRGVFGFFRRGR